MKSRWQDVSGGEMTAVEQRQSRPAGVPNCLQTERCLFSLLIPIVDLATLVVKSEAPKESFDTYIGYLPP